MVTSARFIPGTPARGGNHARTQCAQVMPETEPVVSMAHNIGRSAPRLRRDFSAEDLVESVRRPRHRWHFLPRHQRLFESRNTLVVPRARLPQNPAIVARVVDRALLFLDLVRAVLGETNAERLQPRTNVLALDAELLVALARTRDGDVDDVVRISIRMRQLERAWRIV